MTPEKINIAIAEYLGIEPELVEWQLYKDDGDGGMILTGHPRKDVVEQYLSSNPEYYEGCTVRPWYRYPNYHGDLNACHEMENGIPREMEGEYWKHLRALNLGKRVYHFTAPQRAKAFLRTVKWID